MLLLGFGYLAQHCAAIDLMIASPAFALTGSGCDAPTICRWTLDESALNSACADR